MSENQNEGTNGHGGGFLKGLFAGALVGIAAGVLFAPQAQAALRRAQRGLTDAVEDIKEAAAEQYQQSSAQMVDKADDFREKGRAAYGQALSAVARGAKDVKERAADVQAELEDAATASARHSS